MYLFWGVKFQELLSGKYAVKLILFCCLAFCPLADLQATHLIGGDLTYRRLTGNQFEVTLKLYRDCNTGQAPFDSTIEIGIFERTTNLLRDSITIPLLNFYALSLSMPGSTCSPPPDVCGEAGVYTDTLTLADNPNGYYISWQRCCRNIGIVNLINGLETGMVYYAEIPNPALHNSSAAFDFDPLPYVCEGQPFALDYSASDPDGDSLVYFLANPLAGTLGYPTQTNPQAVLVNQVPGPYPNAVWTPGYNLSNVFNSIPSATIDPVSGILSAKVDQLGMFALAFEVYEYRNGILIGMIRREIEITSVACANLAPQLLTDSLPGNLTFNITESDTICFNAVYTDADGDNVVLNLSGNAFGGPGILPPFAIASPDTGPVTVSTSFCWNTICGHGRPQPYLVVFDVIDDGCPLPAITTDTLRIYIHQVPQAGPLNIQCIGLVDDHTNRVTWIDITGSQAYFAKVEIFRSHNGSAYTLLQTIFSDTTSSFDDVLAINNDTDEYCYYVIATNRCGVTGPSSDTLCSYGQGNSKLNYIEYVTVVDDKEIELKWEHFPDAPYSTLYIYRSENDGALNYEQVAEMVHPAVEVWKDVNVNVDEHSYCYYMLNRDYCGGISEMSNESCSILLTGNAAPWENSLQWTLYHDWNTGVEYYEVYRKTGEADAFENYYMLPDTGFIFSDQLLNPQEGIYNYMIRAVEGSGGNGASSFSNEIELHQQPYIFLPNAFTPNHDSKNDRWQGYENFVRNADLKIFNRWGALIYSGTGINAGWDGTYNGSDAPQGIYIYEFSYEGYVKNSKKILRGTISLVR